MLWLLRLFREFRELEIRLSAAEADVVSAHTANEELISEKAVLEVRVDTAMAETSRAWQLMQDALNGERLSLQMQINHAVQKSGGGIPYPDAHSLPANVARIQESGPIGRRGRELPSEAAAKANGRFIEELIRTREPERRV